MAFHIEDLVLSIEASGTAGAALLRLRGCVGRSTHFDVEHEIACQGGTAVPGLVPFKDPNGLEDLKSALAVWEMQISQADAQDRLRNKGA